MKAVKCFKLAYHKCFVSREARKLCFLIHCACTAAPPWLVCLARLLSPVSAAGSVWSGTWAGWWRASSHQPCSLKRTQRACWLEMRCFDWVGMMEVAKEPKLPRIFAFLALWLNGKRHAERCNLLSSSSASSPVSTSAHLSREGATFFSSCASCLLSLAMKPFRGCRLSCFPQAFLGWSLRESSAALQIFGTCPSCHLANPHQSVENFWLTAVPRWPTRITKG